MKINKYIRLVVLVAVAVISCNFAVAQAAETITVSVGQMEILELSFEINSFRLVNPTIATVAVNNDYRLQIMGLKVGRSDLSVTGVAGDSSIYTVVVVDSIDAVLSAVRKDLDDVPEVNAKVSLNKIALSGEISNINNWKHLQKVCAVYGNQVVNYVEFTPAPEVMLSLKNSLENAGFEVKTDVNLKSAPGEIILACKENTLTIGGQVYSQKELDKIDEILSLNSEWLKNPKDEKSAGIVRVLNNLEIAPVMLEMDIAFVSVTDEEIEQIGVNLARQGLLFINTTSLAFQGNIDTSESGWTGIYSINSGLKGALGFFSGSGPGRYKREGHMTFKNGSQEWREYHSGGTIKVKIASDNAVGLEDVDYGLIMKIKGGLLNATNTSFDVNVELSYPVPIGEDYDLKRETVKTSFNCPVGHTLVLGGMQSLLEQSNVGGVPFLKEIPVLNWFFSEKKHAKKTSKLLVLMSPHFSNPPKKSEAISKETSTVLDEAEKTNRKRLKEKPGDFDFLKSVENEGHNKTVSPYSPQK